MIRGVFLFLFLFFFLSFSALSGSARGATLYVPDDYPAIQLAIQAAAPGDTVVVRPGTYVENIDFLGKEIVVTSEGGPKVTVIDGGGAGSVAVFLNGEGPGAKLDGFTLTNGTGAPAAGGYTAGGGICCSGSSPAITGNIITGNTAMRGAALFCLHCGAAVSGNVIANNSADRKSGAEGGGSGAVFSARLEGRGGAPPTRGDFNGGGIYCQFSDPTITGNVITKNTCTMDGAGISLNFESSPVIAGNLIAGNRAGYLYGTGGGIYCYSSSPVITGNVIDGNYAFGEHSSGGGIECWGGAAPTIASNVITRNFASYGGGIFCDEYNEAITNNTIAWNAAKYGGGICCYLSSPAISNTIVRENRAKDGDQIRLFPGSDPVVAWCDVEGGWPGTGNIDSDPLFFDAPRGDFHLLWDSPCRNRGSNDAPGLPDFDMEGDPRVAFDTVDIGADEFFFHLYHSGTAVPGGRVGIRIVGVPGMTPVNLFLGSGIADPPYPTPHGAFYLEWPPLWRGFAGAIPAEGILAFPLTVPLSWSGGEERPFQALVGPWFGPGSTFTNLMILDVEEP